MSTTNSITDIQTWLGWVFPTDSMSELHWGNTKCLYGGLKKYFNNRELLHYACKHKARSCLEYLLEEGIGDIDAEDDHGKSPMMLAIVHGNTGYPMVKSLIGYQTGTRLSKVEAIQHTRTYIESHRKTESPSMHLILSCVSTQQFQTGCYAKGAHKTLLAFIGGIQHQETVDNTLVYLGKVVSKIHEVKGKRFFIEIHIKEIKAMAKILCIKGVTGKALLDMLRVIYIHPEIYNLSTNPRDIKDMAMTVKTFTDIVTTCIRYAYVNLKDPDSYSIYSLIRITVLTPLLFLNKMSKPVDFHCSGEHLQAVISDYIDILRCILIQASNRITHEDLHKLLSVLREVVGDGKVPFSDILNLILAASPHNIVHRSLLIEHTIDDLLIKDYERLSVFDQSESFHGRPASALYLQCLQDHMENQPRRLDQFARQTIIKHVQSPKEIQIHKLLLPRRVKEFLLFHLVLSSL